MTERLCPECGAPLRLWNERHWCLKPKEEA